MQMQIRDLDKAIALPDAAQKAPNGERGMSGYEQLAALLNPQGAIRAPMLNMGSAEQGMTLMVRQKEAQSVTVTTVLRGGSLIVGASTSLAWLGTILSGTTIIHPLVAAMLLVSSIGFYLMSRLER